MKSHTTSKFRKAFAALPKHTQRQAIPTYKRWLADPQHPSLDFKEMKLGEGAPIWPARVSIDYRVVGIMKNGDSHWGFIGSHTDYDELIERYRRVRAGI